MTAEPTTIPQPALLPPASAYNRLMAYEDAIAYRRMLIAADCASCSGNKRCDQHATDASLIEHYQRNANTLAATLKAESEASLARIAAHNANQSLTARSASKPALDRPGGNSALTGFCSIGHSMEGNAHDPQMPTCHQSRDLGRYARLLLGQSAGKPPR